MAKSFSQQFMNLSSRIFKEYSRLLKLWYTRGRAVKVFGGIEYNEPVGQAQFNKLLERSLELKAKKDETIDDVISRLTEETIEQIAVDITDIHWDVANSSIEKLIEDLLLDDNVIRRIPITEDLTNQKFWDEEQFAPGMQMRTVVGSFSLGFTNPDGTVRKDAMRQYLYQTVPSNPSYWFRWAKAAVGVKDLDEYYY